MKIETSITLDIANPDNRIVVYAKQGDNESRSIEISITENGKPYTIESGVIARFKVLKADGNAVFNDAEIIDNTIVCNLTQQMLAVDGYALAEIELCKDDIVLSTYCFYIEVKRSAISAKKIESSSEYKALEKYISEAEEAATKTLNRKNEVIELTNNLLNNFPYNSSDGIYSENLWDVNRLVVGNLAGSTSSSYRTTDYFISIEKGASYVANARSAQVYGYDENQTLVSTNAGTLNITPITFAENIKYIKVSFGTANTTEKNIYKADKFEVSFPSSYAPAYEFDKSFSQSLKDCSRFNPTPVVREDMGRYSGVEDLNQYSRLLNCSASSKCEKVDIDDTSDWHRYGVKQIYRVIQGGFWVCNQDGTQYIYPKGCGLNVGDTLYIGFWARHNRDDVKYLAINGKIVTHDIRQYEFAYEIKEDTNTVQCVLSNCPGIEISNIYISTNPNTNMNIFVDKLREESLSKIISRKFANTTWLALGDSITNQGRYIKSLLKYMPFKTVVNKGIGGTTMLGRDSGCGCNIVDTLEDEISSADLITIAYGTNDTNYIKNKTTWSIGELDMENSHTNIENFDKNTFYGAYQYTIEKILSINPKVKIVTIVPAESMIVDSTTMTASQIRQLRDDVAQAVRDVSNYYSIPYVDLYHESGMNEFNRTLYAPDGVHPNNEFGEITAKLMIPVFEKLYIESEVN